MSKIEVNHDIVKAIETINVDPDDVIVVYMDRGTLTRDELQRCYEMVNDSFPNNLCIALPPVIVMNRHNRSWLRELCNTVEDLYQDKTNGKKKLSGHARIRPKKYMKKPVIVEAYQVYKEMYIETLEGIMKASPGDYIITGVNGEQYPCKPDIFEKTYELYE